MRRWKPATPPANSSWWSEHLRCKVSGRPAETWDRTLVSGRVTDPEANRSRVRILMCGGARLSVRACSTVDASGEPRLIGSLTSLDSKPTCE